MADREQLSFTVDTHLLRELGALLVGRDSTALIELIKNAYDADATRVTLHGAGLDRPDGVITVSDNGTGMTFDRFGTAFLRIAGRTKEVGDRHSKRYRRRYTGAKGIGRLAAHKLAGTLIVESTPDLPQFQRTGITDDPTRVGVRAELQWDQMEAEYTDLTDLGSSLTAERIPVLPDSISGTTMTLTGTRGGWDSKHLDPFLREVRGCRPPSTLTDALPDTVLPEPLLFTTPVVCEHSNDDPGIELDLTGQFESGDELWQTMSERANWVIEIDSGRAALTYGIAPTMRTISAARKDGALEEWLTPRVLSSRQPIPVAGPFFQARILVFEGTFGNRRSELASFARQESGVRVFMEGFRVLPYGMPGDDWLKIDRDYVAKSREFTLPSLIDDANLPQTDNEGFYLIGNRGYFGAVLLTEKGAPHLEMVVNREGFVPNAAYDHLTEYVRAGLDLSVRARAALDRRVKDKKNADKRRAAEHASAAAAAAAQAAAAAARAAAAAAANEHPANNTSTSAVGDPSTDPHESDRPTGPDVGQSHASNLDTNAGGTLDGALDTDADGTSDEELNTDLETERIHSLLATARQATDVLARDELASQRANRAEQLRATLQVIEVRLEAVRDEQLALRTLAGVGTQYAAFIHEVNGLLGQAQALRELLNQLALTTPFTREQSSILRLVRASAEALVQALVRQTSYLTDVIGPDARRRRRRMLVNERVESALSLLAPRMNERHQQLVVEIADDLKTPPIFPAEMAIILTNLLTNSIKFAGDGGRILVTASLDERSRLHITVANTGAHVAQRDFERYFEAFESSTQQVDVVLGQGMGMGLPIVRSLVGSYDGEAHFVKPPAGYATAVEVVLPDPRPRRARTPQAA